MKLNKKSGQFIITNKDINDRVMIYSDYTVINDAVILHNSLIQFEDNLLNEARLARSEEPFGYNMRFKCKIDIPSEATIQKEFLSTQPANPVRLYNLKMTDYGEEFNFVIDLEKKSFVIINSIYYQVIQYLANINRGQTTYSPQKMVIMHHDDDDDGKMLVYCMQAQPKKMQDELLQIKIDTLPEVCEGCTKC